MSYFEGKLACVVCKQWHTPPTKSSWICKVRSWSCQHKLLRLKKQFHQCQEKRPYTMCHWSMLGGILWMTFGCIRYEKCEQQMKTHINFVKVDEKNSQSSSSDEIPTLGSADQVRNSVKLISDISKSCFWQNLLTLGSTTETDRRFSLSHI